MTQTKVKLASFETYLTYSFLISSYYAKSI